MDSLRAMFWHGFVAEWTRVDLVWTQRELYVDFVRTLFPYHFIGLGTLNPFALYNCQDQPRAVVHGGVLVQYACILRVLKGFEGFLR